MNEDAVMTRSGVLFPITQPRVELINIGDIAGALSKMCRYVGHTKQFYSVAEHCVLLAEYCISKGRTATDALTALMHDASEAYLCDLPPALKSRLPLYKILERDIQNVIHTKYKLNTQQLMPTWLWDFDLRMAVTEQKQAYPDYLVFGNKHNLEPLDIRLQFLEPEDVELKFLDLFYHLREGHNALIAAGFTPVQAPTEGGKGCMS